MSRVLGIDQLERLLSQEIARRKTLNYDDLCRCDGYSTVRAIRTDTGQIDVLATFFKAWNLHTTKESIDL
jgi:hypothetical protein